MTALRLPAVAFTPSLTFEKCDSVTDSETPPVADCCCCWQLIRYNYSGIYLNIRTLEH